MENAVNAVNKLFAKDTAATTQSEEGRTAANSNSSTSSAPASADHDVAVDTTVDSEVAPAVEHTHVKKQHETREQTFVEKEKHQDHYHTTIQPLKDSEVLPEKHDYDQETKTRNINNDDNTAKAKAEADRSGFKSTSEEKQFESKTKEPTEVAEHVHHHLHETIQPVIEKRKSIHTEVTYSMKVVVNSCSLPEVVDPSVTHKRIDVKERIQEPSENHGITTNSAIPVEEYNKKLDGEKKSSKSVSDKVVV